MHLNYGLIGCGMMGHEHLRNIALIEDATVVGIVEPDDSMASKAMQIASTAERYTSIQSLLENPDLNCIVIVSPNHCHVEQLKLVQELRPLPILVEKPLFTSPDDLAMLESFIASYREPVWVAMEYRYMPPIALLREKVNELTGGIKLLTIREHRFPFLQKVNDWNRFNAQSGGTLVEKCCHFFDLMRLLLKSEPIRIYASGNQAVNHLDEIYDGKKSDIWDNAYVTIDFANGSKAMLELCMFAEGSRYQEEISAVGHLGKVETFIPGPGRFWPPHLGEPPIAEMIASPRNPKGPTSVQIPVDPILLQAGDHNGSTFYQHQYFAEVCRGQRSKPEVTLSDGLKAVQMGLAAQYSARTGQAVEWPPSHEQLST
jgi:predicted dehydrogenase